MGGINTGLNNALTGMGSSSKVILGIVLGGMMAIDMGGPFNKAAYVFGTAAIAAGKAATHIGVEPFLQWFVHIGGSGATLGLAILFCVKAKSKYGKTLGRTTILPSIFNINEPMIFGAPIVLNPMLLIPFIIIPLICATIAWIATSMHLVNCAVTIAPWTLPGPIGAYLACGGDWRAAVLNIILIIISVIIYYPFFKMYDNELLAEEKSKEAVSA